VQTYLASTMRELTRRGHTLSLLHSSELREKGSPAANDVEHFCVERLDESGVADAVAGWKPDVFFSHNMRNLNVERQLFSIAPVVKMMHGYFGTCISGEKAHLFPGAEPCDRPLGLGCLALYVPRRNGQIRMKALLEGWSWAKQQRALFCDYSAIVTASSHMRREYIMNGADESRVHAIPLFTSIEVSGVAAPPERFRVLFLGRMTRLKGGDLLIRAVAHASRLAGQKIELTMAGDGPPREEWAKMAREIGVDVTWTGWLGPEQRLHYIRSASVLAVPSVWPEPFGLVGLEAASQGVPSIAFDVGGISDWLSDGMNGRLVRANPPTAEKFGEMLAWAASNQSSISAMRKAALATAQRMSVAAHVESLERVLRTAVA
jgi:glycosyltransferase involved in cell wall biosynthesis